MEIIMKAVVAIAFGVALGSGILDLVLRVWEDRTDSDAKFNALCDCQDKVQVVAGISLVVALVTIGGLVLA